MFRKSSNTSLQKIFSQSQLLIFALTLGNSSLIFVVSFHLHYQYLCQAKP